MELELPLRINLLKTGGAENLTGPAILQEYIFRVLPRVRKQLKSWETQARCIPDPVLRTQALNSLKLKAFHCQGGAVYAVPKNRNYRSLLSFIVAYQTLCDYLDNLCDRAGSTDGQAFGQLHLSLLDALTPGQPLKDYYRYYPLKDDGGYIDKLVRTCQESLDEFGSYYQIHDEVLQLAVSYSDLQVKKHLAREVRHEELSNWAMAAAEEYEDLLWPEYAAACGSTLAIFALMRGASGQLDLGWKDGLELRRAYFPWICGLHILLDYFIDRAEDRIGGDLNFTFYYDSDGFMRERLEMFTARSMQCTESLPQAVFHRTVIYGLLAMYLSDRKVRKQGFQSIAADLLDNAGPAAWYTYHLCRAVRKFL